MTSALSSLKDFPKSYSIFNLTFSKYLSSKNKTKLIFVAIALFFPFLTILDLSTYPQNSVGNFLSSFTSIFFNYYIMIVMVPLSALFSISALQEEVEDGTIAFYLMQPVSRSVILGWKFLGSVFFNFFIISIAVTVYFVYLASGLNINISEVFIYLVYAWIIILIGLIAFGLLFFALSLFLKKPLVFCILIGYLDQFFISSSLASFVGWFSVAYHIRSLSAMLYDYSGIFYSFEPVLGIFDSIIVLPIFLVILAIVCNYLFSKKEITS